MNAVSRRTDHFGKFQEERGLALPDRQPSSPDPSFHRPSVRYIVVATASRVTPPSRLPPRRAAFEEVAGMFLPSTMGHVGSEKHAEVELQAWQQTARH